MKPNLVHAEHTARLASIDPLLPKPAQLAAAEGQVLLTATAGESTAVGLAKYVEHAPDSETATWVPLRNHLLTVRVAGPDQASALDALLDRWAEHLADRVEVGDQETALTVNWPSRDIEAVPALIRHGLAPLMTIAARPAGRPTLAPWATGLLVRRAGPDDLDVAVALNMLDVTYDAQFGMVTERAGSSARLHDSIAEVLARPEPCAWLAERDGRAVGLLYVDLPAHADWIAHLVAGGPVGYLGCLAVVPDARGGGVGTALTAEAHRALDEAGVAVTLLHHAVPNPRSTPFWYSHGYRPLWTTWLRRPAVRASTGNG
ncbi:GNAT family N-acetyltransferase [Solihabitans fulvus]|uniref:GNAT family N-acetyltransferase n=1 Tax=Solihabitans fulvus TaxID=1892852 RepID=A0A5B2XN24_9PSEU|nr:GNAT family N-acetyltransferase [Solihabitans fulvus]KAA2264773.1 GNAT family N-acetyltransferase [Solihabitans fulvus]